MLLKYITLVYFRITYFTQQGYRNYEPLPCKGVCYTKLGNYVYITLVPENRKFITTENRNIIR